MSETITATGVVATDPRYIQRDDGLEITNFRLASSERRFNKENEAWEYTESNFFTVCTFRRLAKNAASSLRKGDRVIVTGKVKLRTWTTKENQTRMEVQIEAEALGHDLNAATTVYTRNPKSESANGDQHAEAAVEGPSGIGSSVSEAGDASGFFAGDSEGDASADAWYTSGEPVAAES